MQDKFKIGDNTSKVTFFTADDVTKFAILSGDNNPIHLDEEYASKTIFKKPIVHGILVSGLFSSLIANDLPGEGSIYLHQSLDFKAPVFHNQKVKAIVTVLSVKSEKNIYTLETICLDFESGELLIEGKAVVILKK